MKFDLKIVGGVVVDGTGAAQQRADIGIRGGVITEIGNLAGSDAAETINADGALVTPGFVDIHTHYDGQATWDSDLMPSSLHGVTTAVMGNCGVGFAPVRPQDHEKLIALFEGVEDIPGAALAEGIRWGWQTFPEYLKTVDAMPHTVDVASYITHDALRMFVMGDRALASEVATPDDIAAMSNAVREAIQAGAVGFSTGRTDNHRAKDGSSTPASEASLAELVAMARAIGDSKRGVLQAVSDFDMEIAADRFEGEFDLIEKFAAAANGQPVSISLMQRDLIPTQWQQIIERVNAAQTRGLNIHMQVAPRGIGVLLGLDATFHPFIGFPSYKRIADLPLAERVAVMRGSEFRTQILTEKTDKVGGDGKPIPPLADRLLGMIDLVSMRMFRLQNDPNYEPKPGDSLMAEAMMQGKRPLEVIYDTLLEDDGHQLIYFPIYNYSGMNLDVVEEMLHHPLAIPGLGDGGAHCGTICDASMPTYFLLHWARDREKGRFSVEKAVHMLTGLPAKFMGFSDRGVLQVGKKADLNVLDLNALKLLRPRLVRDLPAGGKRLLQDAQGYRATIVSGKTIARDGVLTGARPGRVARPN